MGVGFYMYAPSDMHENIYFRNPYEVIKTEARAVKHFS
jgi:hypothetical protein